MKVYGYLWWSTEVYSSQCQSYLVVRFSFPVQKFSSSLRLGNLISPRAKSLKLISSLAHISREDYFSRQDEPNRCESREEETRVFTRLEK